MVVDAIAPVHLRKGQYSASDAIEFTHRFTDAVSTARS
jgi:hypothetical protein